MFDWILGGGLRERNNLQDRQIQYRLKRIEAKLDVVLNELGLACPDDMFNVVLLTYGTSKLAMVKALQESLAYSLVDATSLVENTPSTLAECLSKEEATEFKNELERLGGSVELVSSLSDSNSAGSR